MEKKGPIRITCAGASIVQGCGASDEEKYSWPGYLSRLLGDEYAVCNAGSGGATATKAEHGSAGSYWDRGELRKGMDFAPHVVTILLGGNDAFQRDNITPKAFREDYTALVRAYQALPTHPQVILIEQTACHNGDGRQEWVHTYANPIVRQIGEELGLEVIPLEQPTWDNPQWHAEDRLHFTDAGYSEIARIIAEYLLRYIEKE